MLVSDSLDSWGDESRRDQMQQLEPIRHIAGRIAHDFNNLLFIISASAEFLAKATPADDARYEDIVLIREATDKAAELTRQLLVFSHHQVMQPKTFEVNEMMREMRPLLEGLVSGGAAVQCVVQLDPEGGEMHADVVQIEQVLMNLVMNARDAMPMGGVLTLSTRRVAVGERPEGTLGDLREEGVAHVIQVVVEDTGVGMSDEVLARAFEPFFTTKDRELGTGLGLTTSYGIVQQSGGTLTLRSTLGVGTRVELSFPEAEMAEGSGSR